MANTTDKSILTAAGKALLAQLNAEEKPLIIDKMIFANVPNRPEFPQPDDVVPTDDIVHQEQVEQRGRLSADSVIYSTTLTSDVGPFEFNWTGAYCSEYGVLVTIDHHALTPKTADEPGVAGNTLVRSVVLEYKDIAEITNITVDASSWQYNATDRMKKMDSDVAQSIIDQNGKDWFIEDGFLVTPSGNAYNIKAGAGYVSGNRVSMEFDRSVQVPNKPSFIYIDAHREGTPTGEQVTLFDFVITAEEKDDYIDSSTGKDIPHYVCKIAEVLADGSVSDLRPESAGIKKNTKILSVGSVTGRALGERFGDVINGLDYGIVGDGVANDSSAFENLIRKSQSENAGVYFPKKAKIFLKDDIDVSDLVGRAHFFSDFAGDARDLRSSEMAEIIFNDDGKDETGRTGINGGDDLVFTLVNLRIRTLSNDARNLSGNFIGIKAKGTDSIVRGCDVVGFKTTFHYCDLGYTYWGGNNYHGNHTVLKHRLVNWPHGTTFVDDNSIGAQNTYIYDCPNLWHSRWVNGIYEYNTTPIKDIQSGCMVKGCYFEHNADGGVNSPNAAADLVDVNNFIYDDEKDGFKTSHDVNTHGFDRCGQTKVKGPLLASKSMHFYDRAGYLSDFLSAARSGAVGILQLFDKSGALKGAISGLYGDIATNNMSKTLKFTIFNGQAYGLPTGWSLENIDVGDYRVSFAATIRPPHIQISICAANVNSSVVATANFNMEESAGGNWSIYRNASSVRIRSLLDGVASDNTCVFVTITHG
ncbi:phage tail protein [Vibrio parahaemolyticus]|uniref:phage tail-collar fiber domain-containing protein n=1 Tax=Vibrio parahaemolyticus TaxID=670 RepID=UPI00235EB5C1|nr:phage tail protein [Vibrio parahaemolyticus]